MSDDKDTPKTDAKAQADAGIDTGTAAAAGAAAAGAAGGAAAKPAGKAAEAGDKAQQMFKVQRIYLKDVSYESPQTPALFVSSTQWKPNVQLHLNTESVKLENDQFECSLTVTVTVTVGEKTAYLAEVKQAGIFLIRGLASAQMGPMLGSYCPNLLFPFAREAVASLVQKGGFPQLLLDPVNFDMLYAQHLESAKQNAPAPGTPQ